MRIAINWHWLRHSWGPWSEKQVGERPDGFTAWVQFRQCLVCGKIDSHYLENARPTIQESIEADHKVRRRNYE